MKEIQFIKFKIKPLLFGVDFDMICGAFNEHINYGFINYEMPMNQVELADDLNLGICDYEGEFFLFDNDPSLENVNFKLGAYRQILNPNYDDRALDGILITKGGEQFLRKIGLQQNRIDELKQIFDSKKGKPNNIINFKGE